MNDSFVERLAYWQFRSVVRATMALGSIRLQRMKDLLKLAAYDELRALGKNKAGVAVSLGISQALVTDISTRLHKPAGWPEAPPMARSIPELLFDNGGSLDEFALEDKLYTGVRKASGKASSKKRGTLHRDPGFYYRMELALRELQRWGIIERVQKGAEVRFHLTPKGKAQLVVIMNDPMEDTLGALEGVIALSQLLLRTGGLTEEALVARCAAPPLSMTEEQVRGALSWCRDNQGPDARCMIRMHEGPEGLIYTPSPDARFSTEDPASQHQLPTLELIKCIKEFLAWLAGDPDPRLLSLKMISFRIRPQDLPTFLRAHMVWMSEELEVLEAKAAEDPDAITYGFNWFGHGLDR